MNGRILLAGLIASGILVGLDACGGGGGGYGSSSPAPTYTVGGTISGSANVVLRLNGANDLTVPAVGSFTFPMGLANGTAYSVTVGTAAQPCMVTNGSGTVGATNVTNVAVSCTTVVRSALLNGAQENPATTSTATGRGAVVVNPSTKEITGGITFTGLVPAIGGYHVHQAPAGNPTGNGPVIIPLTLAPGGNVATIPAGTVLTDAQYASFLAGELYFNVHTADNPGGEIRGIINKTGGVTAGLAAMTGANETPANASTATGRGTIVFDTTTREVLVAYDTHNVVGATVSHIHTGAVGVSGPANVVQFVQGTGVFTAPYPSTLSAQAATDVSAGNTYFNVHSTTYPAGEIRGQVVIQ
jgi:hypothetical protein